MTLCLKSVGLEWSLRVLQLQGSGLWLGLVLGIMELSLPGTFAPGSESSMELSLPGANIQWKERVHLRNTHACLRSANEGNTDMGVP